MPRLAILQMADTPQIESTAVMLRAAGFDEIKYCGPALRHQLTHHYGLDTVLAVEQMVSLGYDRPERAFQEATPDDFKRCDLFVEIKVRNIHRLLEFVPRLKGRILYWRVNGAQPEICQKGGDEVNLPCPIVTACLWYGLDRYRFGRDAAQKAGDHEKFELVPPDHWQEIARHVKLYDTESNSYVFWPPYPRSAEYDRVKRSGHTNPPFTVCHSVRAWGYAPIIDDCVQLGVEMFGNNSPAGQVPHRQIKFLVQTGLALVHLKSVDCPGWALYEAMLAGCPVITGRLLNSRMLAYGLLEHGETCLEFGIPATMDYGRGDMDYPKCLADIREALVRLRDPAENLRIGENGRRRLNELMWNEARDGESFRQFMQRHFS